MNDTSGLGQMAKRSFTNNQSNLITLYNAFYRFP